VLKIARHLAEYLQFKSTYPIDDILFHSEVIHRQVESCPKSGPEFSRFGPEILKLRDGQISD